MMIIVVLLSGVSVGAFVTWCSNNAMAFFIIGVFVETIPITGGFFDLLFAIEGVSASEQFQDLKTEEMIGVAMRKRRFDINLDSITSNILCNILAFLCSFWLVITIGNLSDFDVFFASIYWIDVLSVTGTLSLLICLLQAQGMQQDKISENGYMRQDYSLLDRYNTFLNLIAIWINITLITTSIILLFIYCMKNFGRVEIPLTTGISLLSVELFLDIGCGSKYGLRNRKVNSKALRVGWRCVLVLVFIIVCSSYLFSINTLIFALFTVYALKRWKKLERRVHRFESKGEHNDTKWIVLYPHITFIVMGIAMLVQLFYKNPDVADITKVMPIEFVLIPIISFAIVENWNKGT